MDRVATSTGSKSSGGQTIAIGSAIASVQLISNATNAATLILYTGTSTSGVQVASLSIPASTTAPQQCIYAFPVACPGGCFTVLTGTGASFIITYLPEA